MQWIAFALSIIAYSLSSLEYTMYANMVFTCASIGWAYVGFQYKQNAVILLHSMIVIILLGGFIL